MNRRNIFFWTLNILFAIEWVALAFGVHDRKAWMLENALFAVFLVPAIWLFVKGYFSQTTYFLLFVFMVLHTVGAHYTYSEVPYNTWSESVFGSPLNEWFGWKRNHYDRFLHFLWGLLLYHPLKEIFYSFSKLRGAMLVSMTLLALTFSSLIYEFIEWGAAEFFSDGTGMAFLGTQGDIWDAHKDMALALVGSIIAAAIFYKLKMKQKYLS